MKSKKCFYLISLFVVALVLLVACGPKATEQVPVEEPAAAEEQVAEEPVAEEPAAEEPVAEEPAAEEPAEEEPVAEEPAEEEPVAEEPNEPTEIRLSYLQEFVDLNPLNANNMAAFSAALGLFDTLTRVKPDGTVIPWLADSWDISEDKLTITFHLHEGVMFNDGTPLNADAVVFSANLFQDPEMYLGTSLLSLESWEALDEYTVKFTFQYPDATALYTLANGTTAIISPSAFEEMGNDAFSINPVGSGPYLLEKWEPGVQVVMVKNPNYWQEGVGLADKIIWRNFPDGATAVLAAQSGELDLLHEQEPKDVPLLEAIPGFKIGTLEAGYYALVLNAQIPPFDKVENRQALAYALDYEALINVGFEGYATIADGLITTGSWAYKPREAYHHDVDMAKELLTSAGNPDGFDFKVTVTPQPFRSQLLQIMQSSLAEVGINLEIEVNEFARHIEILLSDYNGANAAFVVQNLVDDPALWLRVYAGCTSVLGFTGSCDENNPVYSDLITKSTTQFDLDERIATIQEVNDIAMQELWVVPYAFHQTIYAWNADKLGDYVPTSLAGYNYLFIQPK